MATVNLSKVISTPPAPLTPNCVYFVRTGDGFDLYCTDLTGAVAHKLNTPVSSLGQNVDGGNSISVYGSDQSIDGGGA